MAPRVLAAGAAALLLAGAAANFAPAPAPVPTTAPAGRDLSITPFNISMDCLGAGTLPTIAGLRCNIFAAVSYSGAYDTQALVSLQLDGHFANGSYYVFARAETLGSFQADALLMSSTTVNWTVWLPPSFETVQLLASVVVDWPNEVQETNEANNVARRLLQQNGLPYIVFVEHDLIGIFPYGVDVLNSIYITLDKPLPANAILRLNVDNVLTTNVDAQTNVLSQEIHRGPRTFYEYQIPFGMGSVRPLGRDGGTPPAPYVQVPYVLQLVFLPPAGTPVAFSNITGATPVAASQNPGYVAQSVGGFFRYTNFRAIVNDFITLAPADANGNTGAISTPAAPNPSRAVFVRNNLVTKAIHPNQRSANFVLSSTISASYFTSAIASAYAYPGSAATWGSSPTVAAVLGGNYGASLVFGSLTWAYSSADASFRLPGFAGNVSVTAAGTTFNIPLTITSNGATPTQHVTEFLVTLLPPVVPQVSLSSTGVSVALPDNINVVQTVQWSTPKSVALFPANNNMTLLYVPSPAALAFISNGATQGVLSTLVYVNPADSAPFLTPSGANPLLRIRKRTLSFILHGPSIAFADDASRLQRLAAGNYWGSAAPQSPSTSIGGLVNFTLDVGAGASSFLSRIDYTLRWLPYNVTARGFQTPLSTPLTPSTYVGYAIGGTSSGLTSAPSALASAAPLRNLSGTTQATLIQLNLNEFKTGPVQGTTPLFPLLSTDSRFAFVSNLDFTSILGAVEAGGPGTAQLHPDVHTLHFDRSDFQNGGQRRALGAAFDVSAERVRRRSLQIASLSAADAGETALALSDDTWPTMSTAEATDLSYGRLAHYWPSISYVGPRTALIAAEARVGWINSFSNFTVFNSTVLQSQVRVFVQQQNSKKSADLFWTVSNDTLTNGASFNGFPAISSYYTISPAIPTRSIPLGNSTVVVWVRDMDGNTQLGTHWTDQSIFWSRLQQAPLGVNSTDFNATTWSAPAPVPGPSSATCATIEALTVTVDATFAFMTRVDPTTRVAWLHVWRTAGGSAFATPISSDSPASQVKFLRDASGSGFTVAYVTGGVVKFARGSVTDNGASAAGLTIATPTSFPAAFTTTIGVSVLSACLTPYGHALAWLTKVGLVVAEYEYNSALTFLDTVVVVDNGINTPKQQSVANGYNSATYVNDPFLARQKGLSIAYVDTFKKPSIDAGANAAAAFNPARGPNIIALVMTEDFSQQVLRQLLTYSAYSNVAIVNVTFPSYDYAGATFRARVELKNFGAVRSPPLLSRITLGTTYVAANELGRTVIPPILAGRTVFVEINAMTPTAAGFSVLVDAAPQYGYGAAASVSSWTGSASNLFLDNVALDSTTGLNFVLVNAGPLFGTVTVCGQGTACVSRYVSQWSNVSVAVTDPAFFISTAKVTVQAVRISALSPNPPPFTTWATAFGTTFQVPLDVNPWDSVTILPNVFAGRSAVTPDTLIAYPSYKYASGSNPTTLVTAVGVTNLGNVPWSVSLNTPSQLHANARGTNAVSHAAKSAFVPLNNCDVAGTCGSLGYWCTGSTFGVSPSVVMPGETCYTYFADTVSGGNYPAQTYSSYIQFEAFSSIAWNVSLVSDSSPFGVSALLMAPHVQPVPGASGYQTWATYVPGKQQYNGYIGHYAMWRSNADPLGQPLVVLATGSPVQSEGVVTNVSMFVALESGACANICSESTGGQQCSVYASQCFTANMPTTIASIKLMLWRPVAPANSTNIHYGDFQLIASYTFGNVSMAGFFSQLAGTAFNWYVLPGDVFGWSSPYDNAARVVYSADLTPSGATWGPGGPASSTGFYQYAYIEGRLRTVNVSGTAQTQSYFSASDLLTFTTARQYSFEVGVQPAPLFTGRINMAVDLQRSIIMVSTQATQPPNSVTNCGSGIARCDLMPYLATCQSSLVNRQYVAGTRQLIQFFINTDDGAVPDTPLPAGCSFGQQQTTANVFSDPFAVVVSAFSSNSDEPIFVAGYGAPMFGNSCQTVVLPLSQALQQWILLVNQSNYCTPPVSSIQQLTPLSDANYSLHVGILPASALYQITNYGGGWYNTYQTNNPGALAYGQASFKVAQVLGNVGQTWSLSQCPSQSPASVVFGADQSSATLHLAKANSVNVVATVQTTCSRQDIPLAISTTCNAAPSVTVAVGTTSANPGRTFATSATIPYSPIPDAMAVALDASGTFDSDGDLLTLTWRIASKPAGSRISDATAFKPALVTVAPNNCLKKMLNATRVWFTPDVGGSYVVELRASDGCTVSAFQTPITVVCGIAPTAVVSHVQAVFNHAKGTNGDPNVFYWTPDPLNPSYSDATPITLRAFNSEFFINSAVSPALDWKVAAASNGAAYHFSYEWSIASLANPTVVLGGAREPWNPATADSSGNYSVSCLGAPFTQNASYVSQSSSSDVLYASETLAITTDRSLVLPSLIQTVPAGARIGGGSVGRFSTVSRVQSLIQSSSNVTATYNQTAPLFDYFVIESPTSPTATLVLPGDIRCRGAIDVRLRVIDKCDPTQVAEFRTPVVTQCPPAPVAIASVTIALVPELATFSVSTPFPPLQLQPGVQLQSGDGALAPPTTSYWRWYPANALTTAALAISNQQFLTGTPSFNAPWPGFYNFTLLLTDGCWRDYISNDTLAINAVCRTISIPSRAPITAPTGSYVLLNGLPSVLTTSVPDPYGVPITVGPTSAIWEKNPPGSNPRLTSRTFSVSQQTFAYTWAVTSAPSGSRYFSQIGQVSSLTALSNFSVLLDVGGSYTFTVSVSDGCTSSPIVQTYSITAACNALVANAQAKFHFTQSPSSPNNYEACEFDPLTNAFTAYWSGPVLPNGLGGGFSNGKGILLNPGGSSIAGIPLSSPADIIASGLVSSWSANWTLLSQPVGSALLPLPYSYASRFDTFFEPRVPGPYLFSFNVTDSCVSASSVVTVNAVCNPLQYNLTLSQWTPGGSVLPSRFSTPILPGSTVYYVPENGTFPPIQFNSRSVYQKQGPFVATEAWNASVWLNYTFGILENSTIPTWTNLPYLIDCQSSGVFTLADGGFERPAGSSCWGSSVTGGSTVGVSPISATGAQAALLTAAASNRIAAVTQQWAITAGATSSYVSFHYAYTTLAAATFSVTGSTSGTIWTTSLPATSTLAWQYAVVSLASYAGITQTFSFSANSGSAALNVYVDTVTLYIAGGVVPPPGVPTVYFQPYSFVSPGVKTVRVSAHDGCMQQSQSMTVVAQCRALAARSNWVFPALGSGVALPPLQWSPLNASNGVVGGQPGFGRWWYGPDGSIFNVSNLIEGQYVGSAGFAANALGFFVSAFGNYTDSLTLLDGSVATSTFDPTKTWNSLAVSVSVPSITGLSSITKAGFTGTTCYVQENVNISTASMGFLGVAATGFNPAYRTVAIGFGTVGAPSTFMTVPLAPNVSPYTIKHQGIVHTCPLNSSNSAAYVTPVLSIAAVTASGFQTFLPSSFTMAVNCTALGVRLFGHTAGAYKYKRDAMGSAIVFGTNAYAGVEWPGTPYIRAGSFLPPSQLGYVVLAQPQSATDGTFELGARIDPYQGSSPILPLTLCSLFSWSDLASKMYVVASQVNSALANISLPVELRPVFASQVTYALTVSDGCTNATTAVAMPLSCTPFVGSASWSAYGTSNITIYRSGQIAPGAGASTLWGFPTPGSLTGTPIWFNATYGSPINGGLSLTPTASAVADRSNSLDAYVYVISAPDSVLSTYTMDSFINLETSAHNALTFRPPRPGTYTLGIAATDGCFTSFNTTVTITAACAQLSAISYLTAPSVVGSGVNPSSPAQFNFVQSGGRAINSSAIYPAASLAVNLSTIAGATVAPWTLMTDSSFYTVTILENGLRAPGYDYLLTFSTSQASAGVYNWDFVMYKPASWAIAFTFYDAGCVLNNNAPTNGWAYCSSVNTTFYLSSQCDAQVGSPPLTFTPPSIFQVRDTNANGINVTSGTGTIYYNYEYNQFAPIQAYPPTLVASTTTGNAVFGAPGSVSVAAKQASFTFTVANAIGFSASTATTALVLPGTGAIPPTLDAGSGYYYAQFSLPNGIGGPLASGGNLVSLYYTVFDGCQLGTSTAFSFYAVCNRTLSGANVPTTVNTYWQGAVLRFQTVSWDASAVQAFNETGAPITTAQLGGLRLNTTWSVRSIPARSTLALPRSGSGFSVSTASVIPDVAGNYTVFFTTTDGCQSISTPVSLIAICSPLIASAQVSLANSSIDLVSPAWATTTAAAPLSVSIKSFDGVTLVLSGANSTAAPHPGNTRGLFADHPISYNWTVIQQPASQNGFTDYWGLSSSLPVNLTQAQIASPVVVVSLRIVGSYVFALTVSDGCMTAVTYVYVTVTCSSVVPTFVLRDAVSYYNADLSAGAQFRPLSLYANVTVGAASTAGSPAGCELQPLPFANRAYVAWTTAAGALLTTSRSYSFNPNTLSRPFYAVADSTVMSSAVMTQNSVSYVARALDFCFATTSQTVTITGACTPAAIFADATVPSSGEWNPVTRWASLTAAFRVAYYGVDGLETNSPALPAAVAAQAFTIQWDVLQVPAGSRLNVPAGCTSSYFRSTDSALAAGPLGMSQRQVCSPTGGVDVVYPVLTYLSLTADVPAGNPFAQYASARGMAVRLEADVAGTYVLQARWSDGCAFNSTTFTLVAACPSLTPAVTVQPSAALVVPVGAAASFTSVALDASTTTYSLSTTTDEMLINPRFFITSAPQLSQFNPFSPVAVAGTPATLRTDVSGYNTSAMTGSFIYRVSTDYAYTGTTAWQVSTPPSPNAGAFSLELLGVNGMTAWFLPDVAGAYAGYLQVQDFCPSTAYTSAPAVVPARNLTAPFSLTVTCVGNLTFDVSNATRTVVANATNWTPIRLLPAGIVVNAPTPSRYIRTFWNLTSAPAGHPWVPLDLSSYTAETLAIQFATMHVANLESPLYATFVPTVTGAYVFTLSVWDPRCPGSMVNQTITVTVSCGAFTPSNPFASFVAGSALTFKQDNVVSLQLSFASGLPSAAALQPVRYSWRTMSSGFPSSLAPVYVNIAGQATTSSSSTLTQGGIAGIVIGVIVGAALIVVVAVLIARAASKSGRGAVAAGDAAGAGGGAAASSVTAPSGPEAGV